MKIALFSSKFLPTIGGSEIVIDNLAREYVKFGAEVVVIAPWSKGCLEVDQRLPYPVFRHRPFISKRFGTRFYRGILKAAYAQFRFDILHCQQSYPAVVLGAKFKERHPEIKLLLTSHGHDLDRDYSRFKSKYIFSQTKIALLAVDGFVALNRSLREQFVQFNPNADIVESSNGATINVAENSSEKPYILFLGRLSERKGIDTLFHAFAKLPPNERITLVVAGSGRQKKSLKKLADDLGIQNEISFLGSVSGLQKSDLIHGAKFLVIPTISWEASSLVAIEAIVAGKAVIGSDIMGINQLVEDGASGLLFEPEDSDDLAIAMTRLLKDEKLRSSIESYNFSQREIYSWESIAKKHLEFYRRVIKKGANISRDERVASLLHYSK